MAFENIYGQVRNDFINRQATLNDQAAMQTAGNALAGGDYTGAANALYKAGDLQNGMTVANAGSAQRQAEAQATQRFVQGVKNLVASGKAGDPNDPATYQRAFQAGAQYAPQMGIDPAHLQQFKTLYDRDPQGALDFADQMAKKELEIVNRGNGGYDVVDKGTGGVIRTVAPVEKPIELDPAKNYIMRDAPGQPQAAPADGLNRPIPTARPNADAVFNAIISQESGGKPGVTGPQTQYGRAQGIGQLLPTTAQAMAQKLGVAWRPDLMTGTSDEAKQYQMQLSRAYFDEAWQAANGDPAQAASYYYAGPDKKIWGPKTRAYAQAVLSKAGGGSDALQGGAGSDALQQQAPPGFHFVQRAQTGGEEDSMTSDARDANAMRYVQTGQMPAMGMGKSARADRVAILNRAAELMKKYDIKPEDWATGLATFKVTQGTLGQVNKVANLVQASENTVIKNADLALSLAPKGAGPTGSPVFDRWIQAGRKNIAGDADVAAFNAALGTVADEYAKVMTTSTGTGGAGTSDAARHEAYSRLNSAMNIGQLQKVIGTMKQEMANRTDSLRQQQDALTAQLRSVGGAPAQPAAAPVAAPAAAAPAPGKRPPLSSFYRK